MSGSKNSTAQKSISFKEKIGLNRKKILTSMLTGFAVPFVLLICAPLSVFFSNSEELSFGVWDFMPIFLLAALAMFVLITAALLLTSKWLHNTIFVLCAGGLICAYIQTLVTTMTFKGLPGDGNVSAPSQTQIIINLIVWVLIMAVIFFFGVFFAKADSFRNVLAFLLILVIVMQTVSIIPSAITYTSNKSNESADKDIYYLSTENMLELSSQDNVIVIVLDCFDRDFYQDLIEYDPDALADFDGFTYYDDNIATYPRTFPATASMISGINTDFSLSRKEYFEEAYSSSPLLRDLKANNYKINLYTPSFHSYDNADVFKDKVENVSMAEGYRVSSDIGLVKRMVLLSSYFWLPDLLTSDGISANSFNDVIVLEGDVPKYSIDNGNDAKIYEKLLSEGLTTQSEKNTFTFLHLHGCHAPYSMDENGNEVEPHSVTSLQQTRGCFKLIGEYINQMKKLGIYEDATIIITGDHSDLSSGFHDYSTTELTALLVKEKGQYGTELRTSYAPVSQENLHAEIVKSAGIPTDHDYGAAYSDVAEDAVTTRTHYFQIYTESDRKDENLTYEITGPGTDFGNWKITNREQIGYIYK